MHITELNSA